MQILLVEIVIECALHIAQMVYTRFSVVLNTFSTILLKSNYSMNQFVQISDYINMIYFRKKLDIAITTIICVRNRSHKSVGMFSLYICVCIRIWARSAVDFRSGR